MAREPAHKYESYLLRICWVALATLLLVLMYETRRDRRVVDEMIARAEVLQVRTPIPKGATDESQIVSYGRIRLADGYEAMVSFGTARPRKGETIAVQVRDHVGGQRSVVYRRRH